MNIKQITKDNDGLIVKNAVRCGVCGNLADRYVNRFQCQNNPSHIGDLFVGIFSDLSYPKDKN
ncbi:MAG: hypothetical protein KC589_06235 [Nanoarchaeota archaeon]|nr:hypothetical protein [Nanoarchaeota archaeon]